MHNAYEKDEKMEEEDPNKVKVSLTIRQDQREKALEDHLNLSAIVREALDERGICKKEE